jgi:hypothetical protein
MAQLWGARPQRITYRSKIVQDSAGAIVVGRLTPGILTEDHAHLMRLVKGRRVQVVQFVEAHGANDTASAFR